MALASRRFFRYFCIHTQTNIKTNPVVDNSETGELKIQLNGTFASVTYNKIDESTYDLVHSSIPEMYQGKGLGSILAQRIFDHLIQGNKKFKVTCEYLQKYVQNSSNSKYKANIIN